MRPRRSRARRVLGEYSTVQVTTTVDEVLADPAVHAVAIATPAGTHLAVAMAALGPASTCWSRSRSRRPSRRASRSPRPPTARPDADVRPHLLLHAGGAAHPRDAARRRARRAALPRLGAHQPRPGAARHRRDVGPRPARPVDPGLHPARTACTRSRSPRTAPTRSAPAASCVAYLTLQAEHRRASRTCTSTGCRRSRSAPRSSAARSARWCGTTSTRTQRWRSTTAASTWRRRELDSDERRRHHRLLPLRRHGRAGAGRARGAARRGGRVRASINEKRAPLTDGRSGLRVLEMLEAASESLRSGGAFVPIREVARPNGGKR